MDLQLTGRRARDWRKSRHRQGGRGGPAGRTVPALGVDTGDDVSVRQLVAAAQDRLGGFDIGVNCACPAGRARAAAVPAAAVPGGVAGSEADGVVYADVIKEVDASGNLTWSWRAAEHLDSARHPLQPHYRREHWPLINGVYPLADGTVAASLRSVSAVVIIDRASGEISWRLGPEILAQQHCPSELPDGSLLLFDNGTFRTGQSVT